MQISSSIPGSSNPPRAPEYWLLVPVALVAAAAAWWPSSPVTIDAPPAQPTVAFAVLPAPGNDASVPNASEVRFNDETSDEPTATF
ncbi:MAG: hypothetical protein ABIQ60_05255 [Burkholderiaceae bacterium]